MKTILILLPLLLAFARASEFRIWTQADTKRTLEAKMTDRKADFSAAKVVTRKGKVHWLEASSLVEADREYILQWEPDIDHLSVKVVGSSSGGKTIRVTVRAGNDGAKATISKSRSGTVFSLEADPLQEVEKDFEVVDKYSVVVRDPDGNILDEEAWNKKTGL